MMKPDDHERNSIAAADPPKYRTESDWLGEISLPADCLWGIHTARARENFPLAGRPVHPALVHAYGEVKLACALTNHRLGSWDDRARVEALEAACRELAEGRLDDRVVVDALQGGAGTSLNMNVNEVIANRALELLGHPPGSYDIISPLGDVNLHQSTNDTFPTAAKLAAIRLLAALEQRVVGLVEAFQAKEREFAGIVKVGRTEYQDATLTTLGREMGAYAQAFARDRWRIYKCEERLRVVNLGGTAIGSGVGAPRQYVFEVVDVLRDISGVGLARAEDLADATQNADVFVEVSGILKALAVSLFKVCSDLRFLSSGPEAGIGEVRLPARQAGSSIMPGKVNPVIPEAVTQAAMMVLGYDQVITMTAASGHLELNPFLPLLTDALLTSLDLLARAADILRRLCVEGMQADPERCLAHVHSSTATATALVSALGYDTVSRLVKQARSEGRGLREVVLREGLLSGDRFDELISPEAVCCLGSPELAKR
jgi:aspartate ammonia-lyase